MKSDTFKEIFMNKADHDKILIIHPKQDIHIMKGLASEIRIDILKCLIKEEMNINALSEYLNLPQSTVATNVQMLEKCGLINTRIIKGVKGNQKICCCEYSQFVINLKREAEFTKNTVRVEMPIGLFIDYKVSPPCGMCSSTQVIGFLDSPESYLEPDRVKAGLLWFEKGFVKYKFPNNAFSQKREIKKMEISMELSSETPGTNPDWKSDISLYVNSQNIGTWTAPGDFGDKRGTYTPEWWKMEGSQYGILTTWTITAQGTFVGSNKVSDVTIDQLLVNEHHSIKVSIGVEEDAVHVGGINIFGRGFGNYDQDIILQLYF